MSKRRMTTVLIATIALSQLVSCSDMSAANKSLYALDAGPGSPAGPRNPSPAQTVASVGASVARDQVLQVRRVNIATPYDGLSLVYRTDAGTYVKDYYNQWVAPPEELFTTRLVDYLSESRAFASVVDARSAAPHRFVLETCINSLYGDFQDTRHPKAVVSARVYLIDDSAGDRRVAYQKHYDITVPLAAASARGLVQGAGNAYGNLLEAIAGDLSPFRQTVVAADGQ